MNGRATRPFAGHLARARVACSGRFSRRSLLIALAGGAFGVLLAYAGVAGLVKTAPIDIPRLDEVHVSLVTLLFAAALARMACRARMALSTVLLVVAALLGFNFCGSRVSKEAIVWIVF